MRTILFLAALVTSPLLADEPPPPLRVQDVRAAAGDWIVLRAETEGRVVRWKSLDRGLRIAPAELALRDPRTALATASRPGKYRVICVTAKGDLPSEIVEFLVIVTPDGPDPPEPKPPDPPMPVDPLARKIREALQADSASPEKKAEHAKTLSGFYSAIAKHVESKQVETVGDLLSDYRNALPPILPADAIPEVRKICGEEVARLAGDDPSRKIDAEFESKLVDLFTRLAAMLSAAISKSPLSN